MALTFASRLGNRNRLCGDVCHSQDQNGPGARAWYSCVLPSDFINNPPRPDIVVSLTLTQETHKLPGIDEAIREVDCSETTLPPIAAGLTISGSAHDFGTAVRETTLRRTSLPQPLPQLPLARTDCEALITADNSCGAAVLRPTPVHETSTATVQTVSGLSQPPEPPYSTTEVEPTTKRHASITASQTSDDSVTRGRLDTFICNFPGCTAPPFRKQDLLTSHAYVHSSDRPFYCSVRGCPRSEAGKGFKRKNEMLRHGFVHDSPWYTCPFCPGHTYPRPDNLQRHVRLRHPEKNGSDPQLQNILAQKPEQFGRKRRRRNRASWNTGNNQH